MEGNGDVPAVTAVFHAPGVHGIGVAEERLSGPGIKDLVINLIYHSPLCDEGKLDFRMPVPLEGAGVEPGQGLVADKDGKFIGPVLL